MKIAITGTHGSGKTTIALELTSKLKKMDKNAGYMPEVARHSPYLNANEQSIEGQLYLFVSQVEYELRYSRIYDILVSDRCILDRIVYKEIFFPNNSEFNHGMEEFAKGYVKTYDYIFKTSILYDLTKTKDKLRPEDLDLQIKVDKKIEEYLKKFYPDCVKLPSTDIVDFIVYYLF